MDGNKKIAVIVFAGIIAFAINACKIQPPGYVSLYVDNLISVNDTIEPGEMPLDMADTVIHQVGYTTAGVEYEFPFLLPAEDVFKLNSDKVYQLSALLPALESQQTDHMTHQLLRAKDEQPQMLQNQLNAMQNAGSRTPQPTHIIREQVKPIMGSQQTDYSTRQQLMSQDQQIQRLQNQLNMMQNAAARNSRQTPITRESEQAQPLGSQETDPMTRQLLQARNDTILFLRSQLYNLQFHAPTKDTFIVENVAKEMQPEIEFVVEQKLSDPYQELQYTIKMLKTRVLNLEEQILEGMDTITFASLNEKEVPQTAITDTTFLVAYYAMGEIKPLEEQSVLQQIEKLYKDNNVTKITLSGYTDSSGSEVINKKITTSRLNYFSDFIIPWIPKEKVFFQNFGDTFASDKVLNNERRIEIRIHTK